MAKYGQMLTHQKLCLIYVIWPYFTVFYYFNLTKYFVNVMGSHYVRILCT